MKNLTDMYTEDNKQKTMPLLNKEHLLKYILLFTVITLATLTIPTCGVLKSQAVAVGLLGASTFAIIDMVFPNKVYINGFHY